MKFNKSTLAIILMIAGCGMVCYLAGCSTEADHSTLKDIPVKVKTQKAEIFNEKESFAYSGTIEESESTPLSFPVNGTVLEVLVSEGDFVRKGQLLAALNDATFKNMYEMSQAALKQAEDAYKRLQPMYRNGNLPEIKFVEVETGLQQARSAASISQKNLDDCKLYAPVNGFVGDRSIEPGMNVLPGVTAINIIKIDKVFAKISISESNIAHIERGQTALITIGALDHKNIEGVVEEIGVVADPIAHTYKIKIAIPNENHSIKPGMICDARIQTSEAFNSVIIPNQAVQVDENGKNFVFSVDANSGKAIANMVEIGRLTNDGIEIKKGLNIGELVVIAGQQKLVNDSNVEIIN